MKIVSLDDRLTPHHDRAKRLEEARLRTQAHQIEEMQAMMRHCHQNATVRAQFVLEARRALGS